MKNLPMWAANGPDNQQERDYLFVYVWTFARIMSELACEDKADKIVLEGELTTKLVEAIDDGKYKGNNSFMGWLFLMAASTIRDTCFSLYRARVSTVRLLEAWDSSVQIEDPGPTPEYELAIEELRHHLTSFEDDTVSRLMHMIYVEDVPRVRAAKAIGITEKRAAALQKDAIMTLSGALVQ